MKKKKDILIRKASGDEELFSKAKLEQSLINAGAKGDTIKKIIADIDRWLYHGISTKKIYTRAFSILRREKTTSHNRYKLKQAILEIGPTGYPFESLIGQLFQRMGFTTQIGITVDGQCVTHEMDVIATHEKEQHLVECKYHKDQGKQVSVQVPLYVRSRVNDIIQKRQGMPEYKNLSFTGWVITNTRFSADSIQYGSCSGLSLLAWDYPFGKGLKDLIERYKLYPITILSNLTKMEKQHLLSQSIVACAQLLDDPELLGVFDFEDKKLKKITQELTHILS